MHKYYVYQMARNFGVTTDTSRTPMDGWSCTAYPPTGQRLVSDATLKVCYIRNAMRFTLHEISSPFGSFLYNEVTNERPKIAENGKRLFAHHQLTSTLRGSSIDNSNCRYVAYFWRKRRTRIITYIFSLLLRLHHHQINFLSKLKRNKIRPPARTH